MSSKAGVIKMGTNRHSADFGRTMTLMSCLLLTCCVFGQDRQPWIFEQDVISTEFIEFSITFSAKMDELYFTRSKTRWGKESLQSSIYMSVKQDGKWAEPVLASFSGRFNDSDPHLTRDGKTLFFISERPSAAPVISSDIWLVRRLPDGAWAEPERLDDRINSVKREYGPRTTVRGDLYFASDRDGGHGQGDIYVAKIDGTDYKTPENLGRPINGPGGEWNLEISDDGQILIFEASGRKENKSAYGDLYISFKDDNTWTRPQNISELNTTGSDLYAELSADGNLYYSSSQALGNEWVHIYSNSFKPILDKYRKLVNGP